jgi:hypothetical protein
VLGVKMLQKIATTPTAARADLFMNFLQVFWNWSHRTGERYWSTVQVLVQNHYPNELN